jgi:hypothetical protein
MKNKLYSINQYIVSKIPVPIHSLLVKIVCPHAVKAMMADKQTPYTRTIRAIWRAL